MVTRLGWGVGRGGGAQWGGAWPFLKPDASACCAACCCVVHCRAAHPGTCKLFGENRSGSFRGRDHPWIAGGCRSDWYCHADEPDIGSARQCGLQGPNAAHKPHLGNPGWCPGVLSLLRGPGCRRPGAAPLLGELVELCVGSLQLRAARGPLLVSRTGALVAWIAGWELPWPGAGPRAQRQQPDAQDRAGARLNPS